MSHTSTVFIPQVPMTRDHATGEFRSMFSMESAQVYGQQRILFEPRPVIFDTVRVTRHLNHELRNFSDEDWIICVGDPSLMTTTVAVAARINGGRFGLLKWDRRSQQYAGIRVDISGKAQKD